MRTWLASVSHFLDQTLKFSLFSAQLSGFSADFHRKSLDIVKGHPNNARIWANTVFQLSYQGPPLVNISSMVRFDKNWGGGWKMEKIWVLAFQKVAKTGNIEKNKFSGRRYRLCKIPQ